MNIIIVDNRIDPDMERRLICDGNALLTLPPDPDLGEAVASHPDTLLFCCDGEIITTADYCDAAAYLFSDLREYRPNVKITFTADRRMAKYPYDCIMNALVIGNKMFVKTDSASDAVLDFAKRRGYEIIHTSQGYPACSVLHFGNSAITADKGLARLMEENGVEVTHITEGHISLPPYQYGFIGGAAGVVGRRIYFFGDPMLHPDGERITKAIRDKGYIPVALCNRELRDLGGIICL